MSVPVLRRTLATAAAGVVALALTACTDSRVEDSAGTDGPSAAGSETRTIATKFGDVEVTGQPQRVVALGWGDAETALALGVQPVGASDWLGFGEDVDGVGPWAQGLYDTSPELLGTLELDTQAVGALEPDLILDVRGLGDQDRHDALEQIGVPVISIPEGADNYLTDTEQQVTMIAAALGKQELGEQLLSEVDTAFTEAADAHPEFAGKTSTVSAYSSDGWGVYTSGDARVQFLQRLGFEQKPEVEAQATDNFFVPVSNEELELIDADVAVSFPIFVEASQITDQPLYQALPVVAEGRSVLIEDAELANAFSIATTLGIAYAIDNVVPLLADAAAA